MGLGLVTNLPGHGGHAAWAGTPQGGRQLGGHAYTGPAARPGFMVRPFLTLTPTCQPAVRAMIRVTEGPEALGTVRGTSVMATSPPWVAKRAAALFLTLSW